MTTFAHALSGSYIAITTGHVDPSNAQYIATSFVAASILDLDHLYYLIRDRAMYKKNGYNGQLHKARSPLHELIGFLVIGVLMLGISFFDQVLAYVIGVSFMVHLAEDIIMGIAIPFNPIDKTEINLIPQKKRIKIVADLVMILVFGFLWIQYLAGPK